MRVPEFYKYKTIQILIAGMVLGSIVSWFVFLYMFGSLQEKQIVKIQELEGQVNSLEKDKETLFSNIKELNKENAQKLTIENIEIKILNGKKFKISSLTEYQLKMMVRDEISNLITKKIEDTSPNIEFIEKTIENRTYEFDDFIYTVKVSRIVLTTTFKIDIEIDKMTRN